MDLLITEGTEIKSRIISEISKSTKSICLAVFLFTDKDIANSIIEAKKRGVDTFIILDSDSQNEPMMSLFNDNNVQVQTFTTANPRGKMHHKFCLIDNRLTIYGTFNYTYNASRNNEEDITVTDSTTKYNQFHEKFEKLRENLNLADEIMITESLDPNNVNNPVEEFRQTLHHLIFSSTDLNTEEFRQKGFDKSEQNQGNIDIFRTELSSIKEQIRIYATHNGLGSKKNLLQSNISNAFENTNSKLESNKKTEIESTNSKFKLSIDQTREKISLLKEEKNTLEIGNSNTGEKGLHYFNLEIDKKHLEKRNLESSLKVKKFWNLGTSLTLIALLLFSFYLSVFFGSAIFKVFFETNIIENQLEQEITPQMPQLVDGNAISKIFEMQGIPFGLFAALFFIIPVLFSNLYIFGSKNKVVNKSTFVIGILIFDIIVSFLIASQKHHISYMLGKVTYDVDKLAFREIITQAEFWLIFVFGMIPLIITHFIISSITKSYNNSRSDLVDSEKANKIYQIEIDLKELNSNKDKLTEKLNEKIQKIEEKEEILRSILIKLDDEKNQIETKFNNYIDRIKSIFDEYSSKVISGKIFTDEILGSILTSFVTGYIDYLPKFYASEEVTNRVREIERTLLTD